MAFYNAGIFYGSGAKYRGASTSASQAIPLDLRFYRTSQDGIYVFWWGFDPAFISPSLSSASFDLELDTSPLFNTGNLVTWTEFTAITYQNGNVRKGFAVPVAARINAVTQTWYARVRTRTPSLTSDWSAVLTWTIPPSVQQTDAEALMKSLPDYHVYGKGDLLLPVDQRNSNLWVIENMYGNQLDAAFYETFLTQTNNYVDLAVDEVLFDNFGILFEFPKPNSMQYVDYRWILMNLYLASLVGGTNQAVIDIVQAFTGVPPAINNVRDFNNFILTTTQDAPITPAGFPAPAQTVFFTSTPYTGELTVEDITTGLLVPSSAYVADRIQGKWTMNVGTYDTLQATFDTGNPIKVFNSLQGATALTGMVTFTHNSNAVTGSGTLFLSQVNPGQQITDPEGIYLGIVSAVLDNTHLTLSNPWAGPTETVIAYRLLYTDLQLPVPVLWDKSTLGFGIIITIFNPGLVPAAFIQSAEALVLQLVPAHIKVYFLVV